MQTLISFQVKIKYYKMYGVHCQNIACLSVIVKVLVDSEL